jgi:hypothetical protein
MPGLDISHETESSKKTHNMTYELFTLSLLDDLGWNPFKLTQRRHRIPPRTIIMSSSRVRESARDPHPFLDHFTHFKAVLGWDSPASLQTDLKHRT